MRFNTELEIKLSNLDYNYDLLKNIAPSNEVIFMIKANAYGHGLLEIAFYAYNELKITRFGCASLGEAIRIRENFPKMKCELWVFSDTELSVDLFKESYLEYNIVPVIHHIQDLEKVLTDKEFSFLPLVIKIDTGMNRLGMTKKDLAFVIEKLKTNNRKSIFHLMTHFSNSYKKLKTNDRTCRQYDDFLSWKKEFMANGITIEETSCANSGSIEQKVSLEESHIRPGLMLYGPSATNDKSLWSGKTISSFKTKVIKHFPIKKGTPIGYGGHICGKNGFIFYLPVGYGDGVLTYYTGSKINFLGHEAQIIGRINMDLTAVFVENLPEDLSSDSKFVFWDDDSQDISDLAIQMRTIPYQLFTALTSRVPRRYIS